MPPPTYDVGTSPSTIFLAPTSDNRGIPQRKTPHYSPPVAKVNGNLHANGTGPRQIRPLTVSEALQYSPLSSIVPFGPDVIPFPTVGLPGSQPIFSTHPERELARQPIELLNRELGQSNGTSGLFQRTLQDLQPYLNPDQLTEFKFKVPAGLNRDEHTRRPDNGSGGHQSTPYQLSPFANMMLESTDVAYRYPTPSSPGSTSSEGTITIQTPQKKLPDNPATPQILTYNEAAFTKNAQLNAAPSVLPTPERIKSYPVVIVPPLPPSSQHSEYITFPNEGPESGSKGGESRKRKRGYEHEGARGTAQIKDQRAVSNEASRSLRELIREIFEAEDRLQSDISGTSSDDARSFFVSVDNDDKTLTTLAPAVHVKLELAIQKVISCGRFSDVAVDQLCRLQKLCEGALIAAEAEESNLESDLTEDNATQWLQRIDIMDSGLRAARTITRIMAGGREEKQIYSEELLQSVVSVVRKATDSYIVPVVESRSTGSSSKTFQTASAHRKNTSTLMHAAGKVLKILANLLVKIEVAETTITAIEFFLTRLLFVENAHSEKESVLGIQKFEALRRIAMDIIAEIFSRYPEQRTFLFDEILTSLQKLPVTRQSARQFKLKDGKSIQLVSALIMRLVQTSGMRSTSASGLRRNQITPEANGESHSDSEPSDNEEDGESRGVSRNPISRRKPEDLDKTQPGSALQRLSHETKSLSDSAAKSAQYVVQFFVSRALTATKTGDQPHRQLLDIFAEDLIAVLGSPEWPGAELLLRILLIQMVGLAEQDKGPAPAKTMALEMLGVMGSAISDLAANIRYSARILESDEAQLSGSLIQLLDDYLDGRLEDKDLLGWEGPYRAVMVYLQSLDMGDLQTVSAQGYYATQWAKGLSSSSPAKSEESDEVDEETESEVVALRLQKLISGGEWTDSDNFESVSTGQGRLAYALTVLSMGFCKAFDRVLRILLDSISSDQITVRSRSLKSVTHMLEKDPSLLDRAPNVVRLILRSASDSSSMVRDSALVLIGKCILLRPALEQEVCKTLLTCTNDSAIGIRKRSMKLLKDIYLRTARKEVKTAIADSLLHCAQDSEKSVSDAAKQIFEEIWLSPYWIPAGAVEDSVQTRIALREQTSLVIRTVQRGESVISVLYTFLQEVLSNTSKNTAANFNVCKSMVAMMFEATIDTEELPGKPEQQHVLRTLTVFARAHPRLFTPEQLQHLQPYIGNLSSADDLVLFRSVVVILRCVLPTLSTIQSGFLRDVQNALLVSVSKLGKAELDEVAACLWTINGVLNNTERLIKLTASVLRNVYQLKDCDFADTSQKPSLDRVKKYIRIAGSFGRHCDFEKHAEAFHQALPWWNGTSVAGLVVSSIRPFTSVRQPISLRAIALDSIGLICQSWPKQYNQQDMSSKFMQIFTEGHPELQNIVLSSFRDFFAVQDRQVDMQTEASTTAGNITANGKLGGSMTASDNDGASALIAQRFLKRILRIALSSQDGYALTATEVIASIMRQGLVHPKECGPALVALETSTNQSIASLAYQEHRKIHQQHESMFEREYMRAIHEAFIYQRDIAKDPLGAMKQPCASKLRHLFEVIKTSSGKYQKKFLSHLCSRIDFDPVKLDVLEDPPPHLQYARFLVENLAFFDYGRLDELQHTITSMERIVAGTGAGIAHNISTEILGVTMQPVPEDSSTIQVGDDTESVKAVQNKDVNPLRLRELTTASIVLSMLWDTRTFLRRQYGLNGSQQRRESKAKVTAKDLNKAPSKVLGVIGDRHMDLIAKTVKALETSDAMLSQCRSFVELLSVDHEIKVATEDDDDGTRPETPSADDDLDTPMSASGGSKTLKRKGSISVAGTPHKRKRGKPSIGKRKKSGRSADGDDDDEFDE